MSTLNTTLKGQAGATTSFASSLIDGFSAVSANLAARAERRRVHNELSHMSDRDLADIGIGRADIDRVAGYGADPALALSLRR